MSATSRIVVTGMGVWSPIGKNVADLTAALERGQTGIKRHENIIPGNSIWAALVEDYDPSQYFSAEDQDKFDRTAQMGYLAAAQSLSDAGVTVPDDATRCGLILGTSHGGRSQLDRFVDGGSDIDADSMPRRLLETSAHYHQTAAVASKLGIHGPAITLSNACSSSGAAIAYAIELIRSGKCEWVLAGGADGFSKLTFAGFASLGAMADGPCAPFSDPMGISLGDGAGFIVVESFDRAQARRANVHAELYGYGLSWDAYHITQPEPAGEGMNRAIGMALSQAGIESHQIDYINVHGTGTRANDAAETVGLKRFFDAVDSSNDDQTHDQAGSRVPPISATKSFTGHMLGASSVLGVITSIVGMQNDWLPPTANFTEVRPGCELDCVPNFPRLSPMRFFMAQSAAFAGANAVIVGGRSGEPRREVDTPEDEDIVVSGIGLVSPIGLNIQDFANSLSACRSGLSDAAELNGGEYPEQLAGLIKGFNPRKLMPTLNFRRVDNVAIYATVASSLALQDAKLWPIAGDGGHIGLVVGIARGAATSYQKYLESVKGGVWAEASAVYFPNLVMSSVGGQVTSSLGIRGITSSLVGAGASGLQAITHALELFRRNRHQDAVIVVTSDELAPLYFQLFDRMGLLNRHNGESCPQMSLGEGAVAWVLERASSVAARQARAWGRIRSYGLCCDAHLPRGIEPSGRWLRRAIEIALESGKLNSDQVAFQYKLASGRCALDSREDSVLNSIFGNMHSIRTVTPLTGYAEAASGMFNATAALLNLHGMGLADGQSAPATATGALVVASGEEGSHAAICLDRV
ncbi:MAG: hypothetical protein IT423_17225 [Pirellulaceae bacterium]|nr:hypothetical protein [Pirellulaceae bacterium]